MGFSLFTTVSRLVLGPTQPPNQWVLDVKWMGHEADHSPPSNAKVKNARSHTCTYQYILMMWCLVKHGDSFTLPYLAMVHSAETFATWQANLC